MPPDVPALTRVFPVLLQVDAIAAARRDQDAGERRSSRAPAPGVRGAARRCWRRLADRRPLVVCIDDLQWADADSAVLLEELLRPPSPPAMLTVLCFRSEETAAKPFLQALLDRAGRDAWSAVSLEPMTEDEAHQAHRRPAAADSALTDHERSRMTREAGGNPFVLEQLARYAGVDGRIEHAPTFARMFETRLGALSPDARRFLETLAICGRPMAPELICDACGDRGREQSLVAMLRASHFIRSSGSSERIETYHDRIREALAAQIAARRRAPDPRPHGAGARRARSDDCEALFEHYRGAGDHDSASIQAGLAGAKASAALAFDRAAFSLPAGAGADAGVACRRGMAGRIRRRARQRRTAGGGGRSLPPRDRRCDHARRVELQRRAAEQFLIGGHIDRGLDLIRSVLASVGIRPARSPRAALVSLLWRRVRLRWRGLRFVSRRVDDIDADALLRVDTCWSAVTGLAMVDVIGASDFSARHLLMALDAGEPSRIARAMAIESVARGAYPTGRTLSERLLQQSRRWRRASGTRTRSPCPSWPTASLRRRRANGKRP